MDNYNFLLNCRKNSDYHFFGKLDLELITWEEVILELETHIQNYLKYDPQNNLRFVLLEPTNIKIQKFLTEYSKLNKSLSASAHIYMNFITNSGGNGNHKDSADVLFWQCIGKTHWVIETLNGTKEHTLTPGEAIYIPKDMWHHVTSLTPRVGVSFGLDYV